MRVDLIKKRMFTALIYYAPWVNIINYRISATIAYAPILLIFCVLFLCGIISRTKLSKVYFRILRTHFLFFISLIALFTYYLFSQSFDSLFLFFNLFAFLIVIIPLLFDIGKFGTSDLDKYISYLIIIISGSIMVDFILMKIGLNSYQLMYKSELHSYLDRPFGLFGQPSVNSSLLCFFYLFKCYINDIFLHKKIKAKYLILVTIAIIAQGSGSGYISFFIMLIPILSPYFKQLKYLIFVIIFYLLYLMVHMELIDKLSISYLEYLYYYGIDFFQLYASKITSLDTFLFGIPEKYNDIVIDFGPLFYISHIGIVVFFTFSFSLFLLFRVESNKYFRCSLFLIAFANLHYPAMFYFVMHFIWLFVFYTTYNKVSKVLL